MGRTGSIGAIGEEHLELGKTAIRLLRGELEVVEEVLALGVSADLEDGGRNELHFTEGLNVRELKERQQQRKGLEPPLVGGVGVPNDIEVLL